MWVDFVCVCGGGGGGQKEYLGPPSKIMRGELPPSPPPPVPAPLNKKGHDSYLCNCNTENY